MNERFSSKSQCDSVARWVTPPIMDSDDPLERECVAMRVCCQLFGRRAGEESTVKSTASNGCFMSNFWASVVRRNYGTAMATVNYEKGLAFPTRLYFNSNQGVKLTAESDVAENSEGSTVGA